MPKKLRVRRLVVCFLSMTAFAKADSLFPLWKTPATAGVPPYGASVVWYSQTQDYALDRLTFSVPGFPPVGQLAADNRVRSGTVRPNLWLLPFLQVYGLVGRVESRTIVRNVPLLGEVTSREHGTFHGGGAQLVAGRGAWFSSVNANYSDANMSHADSSLRTLEVQPRIGRSFGRASLWLGAMYQRTKEVTGGVFPVPGLGDVPYSVVLKTADAWNGQAGAQWIFNRHFSLVGEAGFIRRESFLASLEFAW